MNTVHLVCPHCNTTNRVPADKLQAVLSCGKCQGVLLDDHPNSLDEAAFHAQLSNGWSYSLSGFYLLTICLIGRTQRCQKTS